MRVLLFTVLLLALAGLVQGAPAFRRGGGGVRRQGSSNVRLHKGPQTITSLESLLPGGKLPDSIPQIVDWRKDNYVTDPVNGGQCAGVETADAETTNIAGQIAVKNQVPVVPLSWQELIDCAIGCEGSTLDAGARWAIANNSGHIATKASYVSGTGANKCNPSSGTTGATITKVHHLPKHETTMAYAVATMGPIVIALDAMGLQTYISGVLTDCPANQIDDGASLVGYNTQAVPPYWILKNSWGTDWGLNGYAYIAFGNNTCGITTDPSTAEVKFN